MPGTAVITCLGTATVYTPKPNPSLGYDRGETLSFIASCIAGFEYHTQGSQDLPLSNRLSAAVQSPQSQSTTVIAGPDNLGFEVGDRIAEGLLAALEAIARGENRITLLAHSRGAVESILIAHELERILPLFQQTPLDWKAIFNSPCKLTKTAMLAKQTDFKALEAAKITAVAEEVSLSLFLLDPVPGGRLFLVGDCRWVDPRFYELPAIVKSCELYLYENERSRGFKPISVKVRPGSGTNLSIQAIPGHHGTGSGNFKSQQGESVPLGVHAEDVQQLLLLKLVRFLKANQVTFVEEKPKGLDQTLWDLVAPYFYTTERFDEALLSCYQRIKVNLAAYISFNKTNYLGIGQEQSFARLLWNTRDERIVHDREHTDTYFNDLFPRRYPDMINREHALLHCKASMQLTAQSDDILAMISEVISKIKQICTAPVANQTDSLMKEGEKQFIAGVRDIIGQISEEYLRVASTSVKERDTLFEAVQQALAELLGLPDTSALKALVLEEGFRGLGLTIEARKTQCCIAVNAFISLLQQDEYSPLQALAIELQKILERGGAAELQAMLAELAEIIATHRLKASELPGYVEALQQRCRLLYYPEITEPALANLAIMDQALQEAQENLLSPEVYIKEARQLYEGLQAYQAGTAQFTCLLPDYLLQVQNTIEQEKNRLLDMLVCYLSGPGIPLESLQLRAESAEGFDTALALRLNPIIEARITLLLEEQAKARELAAAQPVIELPKVPIGIEVDNKEATPSEVAPPCFLPAELPTCPVENIPATAENPPSANLVLNLLGWFAVAVGVLALVAGLLFTFGVFPAVLAAIGTTAAISIAAGGGALTGAGGIMLGVSFFSNQNLDVSSPVDSCRLGLGPTGF